MSVSPLERLMNDGSMQGQVAMLTDNYRSHRMIVRIVNVATTTSCVPAASADPILRSPSLRANVPSSAGFRTWSMLASNECPVVFCITVKRNSARRTAPRGLTKPKRKCSSCGVRPPRPPRRSLLRHRHHQSVQEAGGQNHRNPARKTRVAQEKRRSHSCLNCGGVSRP